MSFTLSDRDISVKCKAPEVVHDRYIVLRARDGKEFVVKATFDFEDIPVDLHQTALSMISGKETVLLIGDYRE